MDDVGGVADRADTGGEEAAPEGKKAGFLPSFLIRILKWVAIRLGFIIVGVTATVITFSLVNRGRSGTNLPALSEEYQATQEPLCYDDSLEEIRGVTSDDVPAIFSAKVSMGFDSDSKTIAFELSARKREIQNIIFLFLSQKTKDELKPEEVTGLIAFIRELGGKK